MPSSSPKQHNFMEAVKHSPQFAKKAGVPQKVGAEFVAADQMAKAHALRKHKPATGAKPMAKPEGPEGY